MKILVVAGLLAVIVAAGWWMLRGSALEPSGTASSPSPSSVSAAPPAGAIENPRRSGDREAPPAESGLAAAPTDSTPRSAPPPPTTAKAGSGPNSPASGTVHPEEEERWKAEFGETSREELRSVVEKLSRVADEERERLFSEPALAQTAFETSDRGDATLLEVESRFASPGTTAVAARIEPLQKYGPSLYRVIRVPSDQAEVLAGLQRELTWLEAWIARL